MTPEPESVCVPVLKITAALLPEAAIVPLSVSPLFTTSLPELVEIVRSPLTVTPEKTLAEELEKSVTTFAPTISVPPEIPPETKRISPAFPAKVAVEPVFVMDPVIVSVPALAA